MGCARDILSLRSIILKLLVISELLEPAALRFLSSITDVWKFAGPEEVKYAQQVRGNDLAAYRLFTFITLVIATAFLFVDLTRPVDFFWVFVMRCGLAIFYALILALSYYRQLTSNELQLILVIQIVATYIIYFAQAFLARMPFFFLTNVLLLFFYTGITVSGLRFRYGLLINVSVFIAFVIVTRISGEAFYKSQEPNLLLNLLAGIIAGGIIEKQKRKNFRQLAELDLLNQQKGRRISILSHDVASPLQSTSGLLDSYSRRQISREELDLFLPKVKARLEVVIVSRVQPRAMVQESDGGIPGAKDSHCIELAD